MQHSENKASPTMFRFGRTLYRAGFLPVWAFALVSALVIAAIGLSLMGLNIIKTR
jgi:hypothetical protein